jgi:DNA-binding FadR family transcriptional regulator
MILRRHAADAVFVALARDILRGRVRPGDPLPAERILSERFEVSRTIVRQATHRLAEMGLVRVRQGGASLALDPASADLRVIELELQLVPEVAQLRRDFIERELLSAHALLVLAERRATAADIAELSEFVEEYADAGANLDELPAFEERFWGKVAEASGNRLLQREIAWWFRRLRATPLARRPVLAPPNTRISMMREIVARLRDRRDAAQAYLVGARAFLDSYDAGSQRESAKPLQPLPRRSTSRRPK